MRLGGISKMKKVIILVMSLALIWTLGAWAADVRCCGTAWKAAKETADANVAAKEAQLAKMKAAADAAYAIYIEIPKSDVAAKEAAYTAVGEANLAVYTATQEEQAAIKEANDLLPKTAAEFEEIRKATKKANETQEEKANRADLEQVARKMESAIKKFSNNKFQTKCVNNDGIVCTLKFPKDVVGEGPDMRNIHNAQAIAKGIAYDFVYHNKSVPLRAFWIQAQVKMNGQYMPVCNLFYSKHLDRLTYQDID